MSDGKRIVEINGVKMELDERTAKVSTVESYKVGDNVKVLVKESYGSGYKSHAGIIVGFDPFVNLPTVVIAYLDVGYQKAEVKFIYLNNQTKDVEICPANTGELLFDELTVTQMFDREIAAKEKEIQEIVNRKNYFFKHFNLHFQAATEKANG